MKNLQNLTLPAAIFAGALTASSTAFADSKMTNDSKLSVIAGHNVVDAVDDLRETTADLAGAIKEASSNFAFNDWSATEVRLNNIERDLNTMEQTLDAKAEATDSSWLNWIEDQDYSVTVKKQVETLAQHLNTLKVMLGDAKSRNQPQIIVSHNVVDQVNDVRETVGDLLSAVADAAPEHGWLEDNERFAGELAKLNEMEQSLDRKAEMSDEQWELFADSPDYRVSVHRDIDTLEGIVRNLAGKLSGGRQVSQAN